MRNTDEAATEQAATDEAAAESTPLPEKPAQSSAAKQDQKMQSLLNEFADVFKEKLPDQLPPSRGLVHEINTGDSDPVNVQP